MNGKRGVDALLPLHPLIAIEAAHYALKAAGGNLRVAQELLRLANIATTAGYTNVDEIERRAALEVLPSVTYRPRSALPSRTLVPSPAGGR